MFAFLVSRRTHAILAFSMLMCATLLLSSCSITSASTGDANHSHHSPVTNPPSIPLITYHPQKTVTYGASWAILYHDMKSLKSAADLSVVGTISAVSAVSKDQDGIVYTDFLFVTQATLLDPQYRLSGTGSSVIIHQTGGMIGSTLYQMEDDPLFQVGEQAILFLHEYSPEHYYVIGGPSGRFRLQNGLVSSINDEGVALTAPLTQAEFISRIQQA